MSILERQAWFAIIAIVITVGIYLVLSAATDFDHRCLGVFGLIGLIGLGSLIGRKEKKSGKVVMDERDLMISHKASWISFVIFWFIFAVGMLTPIFMYGPNAKITIGSDIPIFFFNLSLLTIFLARSVAILLLYRRGAND